REHDGRAASAGGLDDVQRALHVDLAVAARVLHRGHHAGPRGEMEDRARLPLLHDGRKRVEVHDVDLPQVRLRRYTTALAGGEIVDHGHLIAVAEQRVDAV